jgi:hypothetical protein
VEEASALAGASLFFISNTSISGGVELMRMLDLQDWSGVEWVLQVDRFLVRTVVFPTLCQQAGRVLRC